MTKPDIPRLSEAEEREIRKANAGKKWGHKGSAVEHCAKLLAELDALRKELVEARAEIKRLHWLNDHGNDALDAAHREEREG